MVAKKGCKWRHGSARGHKSVPHSAGAPTALGPEPRSDSWERMPEGSKGSRGCLGQRGLGERFPTIAWISFFQALKQPRWKSFTY